MYSCSSPKELTGLLPTKLAMNFHVWGGAGTHTGAWDKTFVPSARHHGEVPLPCLK